MQKLTTIGAKAILGFQAYVDVQEFSTPFVDKFFVEVRDVGSPQSTIFTINKTAAVKKWTEFTFDVSAFQGKNVKISFFFDSVDCINNAGAGVAVENVMIRADK